MKGSPNPEKVAAKAKKVLNVWKANPEMKLKGFTAESVDKDCGDLGLLVDDIKEKEQEITPLRNNRDAIIERLQDFATRGLAGVKGYCGGNSSEYEQAGGTRSSERKKPVRKAKNATT